MASLYSAFANILSCNGSALTFTAMAHGLYILTAHWGLGHWVIQSHTHEPSLVLQSRMIRV